MSGYKRPSSANRMAPGDNSAGPTHDAKVCGLDMLGVGCGRDGYDGRWRVVEGATTIDANGYQPRPNINPNSSILRHYHRASRGAKQRKGHGHRRPARPRPPRPAVVLGVMVTMGLAAMAAAAVAVVSAVAATMGEV